MIIFPSNAIVKAIPKAVPDHFEKRSPIIPRTIGKAAAIPNPAKASEMIVVNSEEVTDKIIQPAKAVDDDTNRIILAENFLSMMPTENLPSVNTAIKKVSSPNALFSTMLLLSMR